MKESYKALYLFSTNCLYYTFHVTIFLSFILQGVNVNFCFIFDNPRRLAMLTVVCQCLEYCSF